QYGAECGFVAKAHPPAHIGICAGGWNAGDGTTGTQDVELFFSKALSTVTVNLVLWNTPDGHLGDAHNRPFTVSMIIGYENWETIEAN
ncbi:MAG: hypothetical protein WBM78_06550, partial [Desulfobacterales bacterium]